MVMSMAVILVWLGGRRFSIPDRSGHLFRHAGRHPHRRARRLAPIDAGRHTDQFGEASAEGAQRRAADREADLGDAEVATTQQRHRALDAPRHQIGVRRLAVGAPELAAEVPGRHVHAAGERLDVQWLGVLPVDPVANAAQPREVAQVVHYVRQSGDIRSLVVSGSAVHPIKILMDGGFSTPFYGARPRSYALLVPHRGAQLPVGITRKSGKYPTSAYLSQGLS